MEKEKILIVEDEILIARDTESKLKKMGYIVTGIAASHDEAIAAINLNKPDLILMDIRIKGQMDGIDTALEVQEKYRIPVVFQTAHADDATVARARVTGSYGYLVKPIKDTEFKIAVENALYKACDQSTQDLSAKILKAILESLPSGILAADRDGFLIYANQVALQILEINEAPMGQPLTEVFQKTEVSLPNSSGSEAAIQSASRLNKTAEIVLKNNKKIEVAYNAFAMLGKDGPMGMVIQFALK
jgi:CheY-like chemotaxis protein